MTSKLKVFDTFAGCGGLSLGLTAAGLDIRWANEQWDKAAETYRNTHPETMLFEEDARVCLQKILDEEDGYPSPEEVDVLVGGPPCQGFCGMNRYREISDPRNSLVEVFFSFAKHLKPEYVVMENVTGILSFDEGNITNSLIQSFENEGWHMRLGILQAGYYGVPQNRWRVFVLGARHKENLPDLPEPLFEFPKTAVHEAKHFRHNVVHGFGTSNLFTSYLPQVTVGDALRDLPALENGSEYSGPYPFEPNSTFQTIMRTDSDRIANHATVRMQEVNMKRIRKIPKRPGAGWLDLPEDLKPKNLKRLGTNSYDNRFGRLHWDGQFNTIVRKVEPYWSKVIHPEQNRLISARECARAQSLPDKVEFAGRRLENYAQIGKAVPPFHAMALGWEIQKTKDNAQAENSRQDFFKRFQESE